MNITSTQRLMSFHSGIKKALFATLATFGMAGTLHADIGSTISGGTNVNGTYNSLSAAITALNGATITGPVTVDLAAGTTEILTQALQLTATGTTTNTITIQKSGPGNNPVLYGYSGTTSGATANDIMFALVGSDYVTINGLDLNNATASSNITAMDYGYVLARAGAADGCQHVIIKNCSIHLDATKGSIGIASRAADYSNTAVAPTSFAGTNSANIIQSDSVFATQGIVFNAAAAAVPTAAQTAGLRDSGNVIGGPNVTDGNYVIYGSNTYLTESNGIASTWNYNIIIQNNKVGNDNGSNTNSCAGIPNRAIYLSQGAHGASATVANNIIQLRASGSGASAGVTNVNIVAGILSEIGYNYVAGGKVSIRNNDISANISLSSGGTPFVGIFYNSKADTLEVKYNELHNFTTPATPGTTKPFFFCYANAGGTGTGGYLKVDSNNVHDIVHNMTTPLTVMLPYTPYAGYEINGNNISNLSRTYASSTIGYNIQMLNAASSLQSSVSGNTISNISTGAGQLYGIYYSSGVATAPVTLSGNNITTLSNGSGGTLSGIYTSGSNVTFPIGSAISNNIINGLNGGSNAQTSGIACLGVSPSLEISNNKISNILGVATTSGPITGIYEVGTTGSIIKSIGNNISNIRNNGIVTGNIAAAAGITTGTNNVTHYIYNNHIVNIAAPNARSATAVYGINILANTPAAYVYYNTIYPSSLGTLTSTDTVFGVTGINFSAGMTMCDIRNNIINISATAKGNGTVAAVRRNSASAAGVKPPNFILQNNILHVNPAASNWLYAEGISSDTGVFRNAYAVSNVNPDGAHNLVLDNNFNAPCSSFKVFMQGSADGTFDEDNLSLDNGYYVPTVASYGEQSAANITSPNITTDITGNTRGINPDMGAVEFAASIMDVAGPLINYTPISAQNCVTNPTLSVDITDASGVNISSGFSPRLYYKKSTGGNTQADWRYVEATSSASPFVFTIDYSYLPSLPVNGETIQYFVIAQDINGIVSTDNTSFAPGVCASDVTLSPAAFPVASYKSYTIANNASLVVTASSATVCPGIADTLSAKIIRNGNATLGNGTGSSVVSSPYVVSNSGGKKLQVIYTAADLKAAGLLAGNITAVGFNITNMGTPVYFIPYFSMKMAATNLSALTTTFESDAAMSNVYYGTVYPVVGWNTHVLDTPFNWDGTSNIILQVCYTPTGNSNTIQVAQTNVGANVVLQASQNASCTTVTGLTNTNRPNTVFTGVTNAVAAFPNLVWNDGTATVSTSNDSLILAPPFPAGNSMTYTLTANDSAGCTLTGNTTVSKFADPIVLTPSTPSNNCAGTAVALNAGVAATWSPAPDLYTNAAANNAYQGNAVNGVYALLHNNHFVTATYNNGTCTFKDSVLVTVPNVTGAPVIANNTGAVNIDSAFVNGTVTQFHNADCEIMATITPNGASPVSGLTKAIVTMDGTTQTASGGPYITRHYEITPQVNGANATAAVTLYFTQAEFDAYNNYVSTNGLTATYPLMPANAAGSTANIKLSQFEGPGATPTSNTGVALVPINSVTWNAVSNVWEVNFNVAGFSSFYLHSNLTNTPLPINFVSFEAKAATHLNQLSWTMADATKGNFEVLHSTDGLSFESLGSLEANNNSRFSFGHTAPAVWEMYKIKWNDADGKVYFSNTTLVQRNDKAALLVTLYPNPAIVNLVTVNIKNATIGALLYSITDVLGKEVLNGVIHIAQNGNGSAMLGVSSLTNGVYNLKIQSGNNNIVKRLVIANK